MTPDQHRQKAERIRQSTEKIDHSVYEMVIEGAYLSAIHWLNYALHRMEVTAEAHDIVHTEHLSGMDRGKIGALMPEVLATVDELETFRTRYVRGNIAGGLAAAKRALELHEQVQSAAIDAAPFKQASAE
tara:strand:+ start:2860 stop:3249 length:390 start_codon:yes stop_codon:yes gene_type:complete